MTRSLRSYVKETPNGAVVEVLVAPRAQRSAFVGFHGGVPKVSLAAPPTEGRANDELVLTIKEIFSLPRRDIELVRGDTSRRKFVLLRGISAEKAVQVLETMMPS